jgi:hypothetical protein
VVLTLDAACDELYAIDPADFVATRGRLARDARAEGDKELAEEIGHLRRPSVAAWSVNQAARGDAARVARLFASGEALGAAREGTDIRAAARRRRTLIDELTDASLEFARTLTPNPETHRDAIDATWEAASIDAAIQPAVAAGHLDKELPRPSGFGDAAAGTGPSAPVGAARPKARTRQAPPPDELAARRARAALDRARASLRETEEASVAAERDHDAARAAADDAVRRVADLERALASARDDARDAARAVRDSERRVTRARGSRERAAREVEQAEGAVDDV